MAGTSVGIQLYTVRGDLQNDFAGTLKALADMGYDGVEFAWNYGGMSPSELANFLKDVGLRACGLHAPKEKSGSIGLKAGLHAVTVEFFEKGGGEVLEVRIEGPGMARQLISNGRLFRNR